MSNFEPLFGKLTTMKRYLLSLIALAACTIGALAAKQQPVNQQWQQCVLAAVDSFPERGGYYTGSRTTEKFPRTAWKALNEAYGMRRADSRPNFRPEKATPSFCSIATYAVLIKALLMWDTQGKITRPAWIMMKPYVGIVDDINTRGYGQDDGVGFWGRANANGPSLAVLVHELKAGVSYTGFRGAKSDKNKETPTERYLADDEWRNHPVWSQALPGDFMKIFWDRNDDRGSDRGAIVGDNGVKGDDQEAGHSVVFLGYTPDGQVMYWSSNGPGSEPEKMGYGRATCDKTKIQRVVFTRVLKPERFDEVKKIKADNVNQYLYDLNGHKHSTTDELKKQAGIK